MENFGEKLYRARKKKGLSQLELAEKIGIKGHNSISQWENNKVKPETETLIQLAKILEISLDYLLLDSAPPIVNPQEKTVAINTEEYIQFLNWKSNALEKENERLRKQNVEGVSE